MVNNFLAELFVKQCFTNGVVLTEDQQDFKQFVTCCDENNQITYVSGKEYRHRAKFNQQKKWEHGLRERHDNYQALIQNMPSMKTADLATLRIPFNTVGGLDVTCLIFANDIPF